MRSLANDYSAKGLTIPELRAVAHAARALQLFLIAPRY